MIVVDTTVLADLLFGGEELRGAAVHLQEMDPEWLCVGLVRYELGNVAWKLVKFGGVDAAAMRIGLEGADEAVVEMVYDLDWTAVFQVAVDAGLTFYDASHVWLARTRNLKLRTRDKQVLRECADVAEVMPVV